MDANEKGPVIAFLPTIYYHFRPRRAYNIRPSLKIYRFLPTQCIIKVKMWSFNQYQTQVCRVLEGIASPLWSNSCPLISTHLEILLIIPGYHSPMSTLSGKEGLPQNCSGNLVYKCRGAIQMLVLGVVGRVLDDLSWGFRSVIIISVFCLLIFF